MKYQELEDIAKLGQLTLEKKEWRKKTRRQYIYDKSEPLYIDGVLNEKALEIKEVKKISYTVYMYTARCEWQAEHECFKIRKADYYKLLKVIEESLA